MRLTTEGRILTMVSILLYHLELYQNFNSGLNISHPYFYVTEGWLLR